MKRKLMTWMVSLFAGLLLTGQVCGADEKQSGGLDEIEVDDFQKATVKVRSFVQQLLEERDKQFVKLIDDLAGGSFAGGDVYLEPLNAKLAAAVKEYDTRLSKRQADKIDRIIIRAKDSKNADLQKKAETALADRNAVTKDLDSVRPGLVKQEGAKEAGLVLAVFNPAAVALAEQMVAKCGLLKIVSMEKDKLEDFLTSYSRPIHDDAAGKKDEQGNIVKKGRRKPKWRWFAKHKDTFEIIRLILDGKTFDALRPAREAVEKKKYSEESHFHLLYAYLLLINTSNPKATEEGYAYLKQTYDELETGQLAYNMVRVGARLHKMDETTLWKLIDHANFNDNDGSLSNLFNLCMVIYLQKADWNTVSKLYDRLQQDKRKADMLMPAFGFIALLHQGEFERIAEEVPTNGLTELVQTARE